MSPTNWNGVLALCAIVGIIGTVIVTGAKLVARDERKTIAIETLTKIVQKLEVHFESVVSTLGDHGKQLVRLDERVDWLESTLDKDGRVSSVVMALPNRRRRGGNDA